MYPTPLMFYKKVTDALRGLLVTAKEEISFKVELILGLILVVFVVLEWPLKEHYYFSIVCYVHPIPVSLIVGYSAEIL